MNSTFAIIKPHILEEQREEEILSIILQSGFRIRRLETRFIAKEEAEQLYIEHKDQEFYGGLCNRMCEGASVIMELSYLGRVGSRKCWKAWRDLIGVTDPIEAGKGTIRRLFGKSRQYNAVHGSDSEESAIREINIFFNK